MEKDCRDTERDGGDLKAEKTNADKQATAKLLEDEEDEGGTEGRLEER